MTVAARDVASVFSTSGRSRMSPSTSVIDRARKRAPDALDRFRMPRGEIVEDDDVVAGGRQREHRMAADVAGAAR